MVYISIKGMWWAAQERRWVYGSDETSGSISTVRRFKTARAGRRHLAYVLDKFHQEITFQYYGKDKRYERFYPATPTWKILFGNNKNV